MRTPAKSMSVDTAWCGGQRDTMEGSRAARFPAAGLDDLGEARAVGQLRQAKHDGGAGDRTARHSLLRHAFDAGRATLR
ncbi:hypothetical protein [Nonomuraea dietziae]|uniref:hypothetical protein n=1 Tax=Nonomuraea dietziae TaxID=65515 RepID=UPI0031DD2AE9